MGPLPAVLLILLAAAVPGAAPLTPETINEDDSAPVTESSPPAALVRVQVLLDRAGISPGVIDGDWGVNTGKAIKAFQLREGLPPTGEADRKTLRALNRRAGRGDAIEQRELTAEDVEGPFKKVPDDVYAQAELKCLCYESVVEKLAERFHTSTALLARLNPGVDLSRVSAGDRLHVPAVRPPEPLGLFARLVGYRRPDPRDDIQRLVVHKKAGYLRALDGDGEVLLHFPVTVGASFSESPDGTYAVQAIARNPSWHFKPKILASVDDELEDAVLPPGPNSPVGAVWIALSKPTFGIHGTNAPETIGYTSSNGCVRLTNWDALFLAEQIRERIPVEFIE
jgi:lipoprotein-anchoring transpeptidase ErfK/SrfK